MNQFVHGGDTTSFRAAYPQKEPVDFSANINPLGMPKTVRDAFQRSLSCCEEYPDPFCRDLREAIGGFEAVPAEWILCGNGAADLIYRIAYAIKPQKALLPAPTFAEYERALEQIACKVSFYPLRQELEFRAEETILKKIPGNDIVFLCNPNNPTGQVYGIQLLEEILQICCQNDCYLVVDECFLDFLPDAERYTMKKHLPCYEKLVIIRAFTKLFAVPGLRLGYLLCADTPQLYRLEQAGAPWSVSAPAQQCGIVAVKEEHYLAETRKTIAQERLYLQSRLKLLGYRVFDGAANFILFYTQTPGFCQKMREKGFLIRDCSNYRGLSLGYYRIAVRKREENDALLQAIKEL